MPRVALNIFKTEKGEYRMVMQAGENPQPTSMGVIVYQDGKEIDSKDIQDIREASRQLKEKAENWAREQGIEFVDNIDINPYD